MDEAYLNLQEKSLLTVKGMVIWPCSNESDKSNYPELFGKDGRTLEGPAKKKP